MVWAKNICGCLQTLSFFHNLKSFYQRVLPSLYFFRLFCTLFLVRTFEKCSLDLLQFRNKIYKQNMKRNSEVLHYTNVISLLFAIFFRAFGSIFFKCEFLQKSMNKKFRTIEDKSYDIYVNAFFWQKAQRESQNCLDIFNWNKFDGLKVRKCFIKSFS